MRTYLLFIAAFFALLPSRLQATDQRGKADLPWKALESVLVEQHQKIDTQSLINLATSDRDAGQRWLAIEILGLRKEKVADDKLRQLLSERQSRFIRETSALALARLDDPLGLTSLREFVADSPSLDRQIYLSARLAEFGDATGFKWVSKGAMGADLRERYLSVAALVPFAKMQDAGIRANAEKLLLALAQDKDADIRKELYTELPLTFGPEFPSISFTVIAKKLSTGDPDQGVRSAAENFLALWQMQHPEAGSR